MSLSHRCGGILVYSSLQNCFNSATLGAFRARMDRLRSCHNISIGLWFGHSKTLILFFFSSVLELEVTNWWPNIVLSDRVRNSWFHQLWQIIQILKLQSSLKPPHYHHHVWLLVWCSFYEILGLFYTRCNGTHTFQKVKLLSHQSTEYLPKIDEPLCSCGSVVRALH